MHTFSCIVNTLSLFFLILIHPHLRYKEETIEEDDYIIYIISCYYSMSSKQGHRKFQRFQKSRTFSAMSLKRGHRKFQRFYRCP